MCIIIRVGLCSPLEGGLAAPPPLIKHNMSDEKQLVPTNVFFSDEHGFGSAPTCTVREPPRFPPLRPSRMPNINTQL